MTPDEMRLKVMEIVRLKNSQCGNNWTWGDRYEELSAACGIHVDKPEPGLVKDESPGSVRKRFTNWIRKVIPAAEYSVSSVEAQLDEVVDAILDFPHHNPPAPKGPVKID